MHQASLEWGGRALLSRDEALVSTSRIPVSQTKNKYPKQQQKASSLHTYTQEERRSSCSAAEAKGMQQNLTALILLHKTICLKYALLCFRFEGPAIRLPVWAGPCLFCAFLLSSVFCFSSSCWVYGRMCHLIWLTLLQVLEFNSQCYAGYTGRPVCSLTFPQTLPWLWESPLTAIRWTQHCSRQAATLSFHITPGNLLSFLCSVQIKGTEKPKGHLERSHLDLWLGLLLMGYHVRGQGREGRMGRRKERVVLKTRRRWTDTGKPCRKIFIAGH